MQMKYIKEKTKVFHALSSEVRLKIIDYLFKSKCKCICHLSEHLKKDQSTIFRHIEILERAGIMDTIKDGKFLYCKLKNPEKIKKLIKNG